MALLDWSPPESDALLHPRLLPREGGPYRITVQAWPVDARVPDGDLLVDEAPTIDEARDAAHAWMEADPFIWRLLGGGATVELYGAGSTERDRSLRIGRRA
jgi:hypothetical protein